MAPHPVAKDKSLAMIGLSWLADLPARQVGEGGKRQPDDILQPFNTVACVTLPRTMPQTRTQTSRRRQTGCLSSSLSPESVASKQKTISRKLTEILQCCFIIISRWGHRAEQRHVLQSRCSFGSFRMFASLLGANHMLCFDNESFALRFI